MAKKRCEIGDVVRVNIPDFDWNYVRGTIGYQGQCSVITRVVRDENMHSTICELATFDSPEGVKYGFVAEWLVPAERMDEEE